MKKFFIRISSHGALLIKEDGYFFVVLTILNLPTIFIYKDFSVGAIKFWFGALALFLVTAAIHFLFLKLRRVIQAVLIIFSAMIFVTDIFLLEKFSVPLNLDTLQILLATNFIEAKDFIRDQVLSVKILFALSSFTILLVVLIFKLKKFFASRSEERLRRLAIDLLIILLPVFFLGGISTENPLDFSRALILNTTLGNVIEDTMFIIRNYPTASGDKIFAEMNKQLETEKIFSDASDIPNVVFILGESTDRNHMQLYGYRLPTTPHLSARFERGEILRFSDTIACANNTASAMALIFTFAEKDEPQNDWYLKANIFDILSRTTYHTFWISNQSPRGIFGNLGKYYSSRCDDKFFVESQNEIFDTKQVDGVLIPALDNFISDSTSEKNFYVIHLFGTHAPYTDRYPSDFEKFSAEDEDKPEEFWRKVTAEYDNAVLYNDFIVDEIVRRFEDKNAVVIYISDHGEEVYEGRNFAWHSMEEDGNVHMIEIPALVWASKEFRERYPEKISALESALDRPYRTDYLIHTLLDLMDIRTSSFDATKSVINKKFEPRPRFYNGKIYK